MSFGKAITLDQTRQMAGNLMVVQLGFKGYDLGRTRATTTLAPDEDRQPINFQQEGTKESDEVRTGILFTITTIFGEISTELVALLMSGANKSAANSLTLGRNLFSSLRETESGPLRVTACDANGIPSEEDYDTWWWYETVPMINGDLVNWGVDVQRDLPVQFKLYYHKFSIGESSTYKGLFGYIGDPAVIDVPPVVWNVGPEIVSVEVTSATEIVVTFDKNVAFQGAVFVEGTFIAKVNDDLFSLATVGVILLAELTLTFPAATFASLDLVALSISATALEDTEVPANEYQGALNYPAVNSI